MRAWLVAVFGLLTVLVLALVVAGARSADEASGLIAFTRSDGVYAIRADGTGIRRLRQLTALPSGLAWSPDGRKLAFATPTHGNVIWVMDADGSGLVRLVLRAGEVKSPAWSPDGREIAYTALLDKNRDIWIMNADGSNQRRLARTPLWESELDWSPATGRIAFTDILGRNVYVMNTNGSNQRKLTSGWGLRDLSWSPDGSRIAFARDVTPEPDPWLRRNTEIYLMNIRGHSPVRLTSNKIADFGPAWSPNGGKIAFVRSQSPESAKGPNFEIFVMNADGTGVTRLTHDRLAVASPAWQPVAPP